MKLKLKRITIWVGGQVNTHSADTILEHDELVNGILIKLHNGEVLKYIDVSYLITRTPV